MKTRIGLWGITIRALLWSKPGTDTLVGSSKISLDRRREVNLMWAQYLARLSALLLCLILGVWVDEPWVNQLILML